ncbi:MAG: hypothetical protein ABJX94_17285 [Flavobacteriaceae bacterium]
MLVFTLLSCWWSNKPSRLNDNVFGTYIFEFPSNQLQVLEIRRDSSFVQELYFDKESFVKKKKPLFVNEGTVEFKEYELRFKHWLSYCYNRDPNVIREEPDLTLMLGVSWYETNKTIVLYHETNYIFEHIDNWKDLEK